MFIPRDKPVLRQSGPTIQPTHIELFTIPGNHRLSGNSVAACRQTVFTYAILITHCNSSWHASLNCVGMSQMHANYSWALQSLKWTILDLLWCLFMRIEKFLLDTNMTDVTKSLLLHFPDRAEARERAVFSPEDENRLWSSSVVLSEGQRRSFARVLSGNSARNIPSSQYTKKTKSAWSFASTSLCTFRIYCKGHYITAKNVSGKVITMEGTWFYTTKVTYLTEHTVSATFLFP